MLDWWTIWSVCRCHPYTAINGCLLDILWAGDEVERDAAGVARTLWSVSGLLPDHATPQSVTCVGIHRRTIRRRLPPVLRRAHQLDTPGPLYHGGPGHRSTADQCRPGLFLDLQQRNRKLPTQTTGNLLRYYCLSTAAATTTTTTITIATTITLLMYTLRHYLVKY